MRNIELIQSTRDTLRTEIAGTKEVALFRTPGNLGDQLIHAGVKALLAQLGIRHTQMHISEAASAEEGDVALVNGSGGWCHPHHLMPTLIAPVEARYRRVIVLPSSFDVTEPSVAQWLDRTRSLVMARERVSYDGIVSRCRAVLGVDSAFFFNFSSFQRPGGGTLDAFREDEESRFQRGRRPKFNIDVSASCASLDEWLETIARCSLVRTDRCHVMIAAAMMGKAVQAWESSYHKLAAIARTMGLQVQMQQGGPPA